MDQLFINQNKTEGETELQIFCTTMVGVVLPDCGGAWVPDTGGGDLPTVVLHQLRDHGQKGVVISGLVAWMEVQMDTEGCNIWRALAERNWQ